MLRNAMDVLTLFLPERRELGVVEAAALLRRSKSTVSRWLSAMEEAGFLDRDVDTGRYRIGMRLAELGELARLSTTLQKVARPAVERLAQLTGETANLVVLSGSAAVNVEVVESPRPIKHVGWLGRRLPLHATAAGKSLLAWRPPEEVNGILRPPFERFTPLTVTELDPLLDELERVRSQGFAEAWGEMEDDLAALAAPVRNHLGQVVSAVTISAPMSRVPRHAVHRLSRDVIEAADAVSRALGYRNAQ